MSEKSKSQTATPIMDGKAFQRFIAFVKRNERGAIEWTSRDDGDPARARMTTMLRAAGVDTVDGHGCWIWTASTKGERGYERPSFTLNGKRVIASRAVLSTYLDGEALPKHVEAHHVCENGSGLCVRPDHLAPLTGPDHKVAHDKLSKATIKQVGDWLLIKGPDGLMSLSKVQNKSDTV